MIDNNVSVDIAAPEFSSPFMKGFVRATCERLFKAPFFHSSTYGTYFLLDSMTRKGNLVYIVALNKRLKPVKRHTAPLAFMSNEENFFRKIESIAASCDAPYVIIAKKGRMTEYLHELYYADRLFRSLEKVKLYDYLTIEDHSYRSYMENFR